MPKLVSVNKDIDSSDTKVWRLIDSNPAGFSEFLRTNRKERFRLWPKQVREVNREDRKKKRIQGRNLGKSITCADEFICDVLSYRGQELGIALVGARGQPTLQYIFEQWLIGPFKRNKFLNFFLDPSDRGVDRKNYEIRLRNGSTIKGRIQGKDGQGFNCFSGNTRLLTFDGTKTFRELSGRTTRLLTRDVLTMENAYWVDAPIRSYGDQELWKVVVRRHGQTKSIFTTGLHRWFRRVVVRPDKNDRVHRILESRLVHTEDLQPSQRLVSGYPPTQNGVVADEFGIRHGIVFGDGSRYSDPKFVSQTLSWADLYGEKDHQLLDFFKSYAQRPKIDRRTLVKITRVSGLPRGYKDLPDIESEMGYLLGWLMGYFAADGHVNSNGIAVLRSSNKLHLEFARDVATKLGYATKTINANKSKGSIIRSTGQVIKPSIGYSLPFVKGGLEKSFFLIEKHRDAHIDRVSPIDDWYVVSVEATGHTEEVFCAEVANTKTIVLEDNLLTGQTVHPNIAAWFDEVQLLSDEAIAEIYGMLSTDQKVLASGVPNGVRSSWAYRIDNNPKMGFVGERMTRLDDPRITEEDIEQLRLVYGGEDTSGYQQKVLGLWGSSSTMTFDVDRMTADLPYKEDEIPKKPNYYVSIELFAADYAGPEGLGLQLMLRNDLPKTAKKIYIHADHGESPSPTTIYVSFFDSQSGLNCWRQYMRVLLHGMQTKAQVDIFHYLADTLEHMFKIKPIIGIDTTGGGGKAVMSFLEDMGHPVLWANLAENVDFGTRLENDEEYLARMKKEPFGNPARMMVMMKAPLKQVAIPHLQKVLYSGELRLVNETVLWKQFENTTNFELANSQMQKYVTDYTGPDGGGREYNHDLQSFEVLAAMLHRDLMAPEVDAYTEMWSEPFDSPWGRYNETPSRDRQL